MNVPWHYIPIEKHTAVKQENLAASFPYASILNAIDLVEGRKLLANENDRSRIQELMKDYGQKKSSHYPGSLRHVDANGGMRAVDVVDTYNEIRKVRGLPTVEGVFLNRLDKNESDSSFSSRVHELIALAIQSGDPPILIFRSQWAEMKDTDYVWNGLTSHAVTVIGVPKKANVDGSFCLDSFDSIEDNVCQSFVYVDVRNFGARAGEDEFLGFNRPFLCASSASLRMSTEQVHNQRRTIIYLHYLICRSEILKQASKTVALR